MRKRLTIRIIDKDKNGIIASIHEQEIPATVEEIENFLRRKPFRSVIAYSILRDGTITIEKKKK